MKRRRGRPYGENYSRGVRVRFPPEVDRALRKIRKLFNVPISHVVRAGVERALVDRIPAAVAIIKDPNTTDVQRLKMVEFLDICNTAHVALHHPELAKRLRRQKRLTEKTPSKATARGSPPSTVPTSGDVIETGDLQAVMSHVRNPCDS